MNDIRFTTKGEVLYVFVMGQPEFRTTIRSLATDTELRVGRITGVELVGHDGKINWRQDQSGLVIDIPNTLPSKHAVAFRVRGATSGRRRRGGSPRLGARHPRPVDAAHGREDLLDRDRLHADIVAACRLGGC